MKAADNTMSCNGFRRKYALIVAACALSILIAATWKLCNREYRTTAGNILQVYRAVMESQASETAGAVSLWATSLSEQAKRISGSELFRLFASEAAQMDPASASMLNEPDTAALSGSEEASLYGEQVTLMRDVLHDFMNYNGLLDARLVDGAGRTLLSSLPRPAPASPEQQAVAARAIAEGRTAFAPVRGSAAGLVLDYAEPILPVMNAENSDKPVAAALFSVPVTGRIAQFLTRDRVLSGDRRAGGSLTPFLIQKHDRGWEEIRVGAPDPVPLDAETAPDAAGILAFGPRRSPDGETEVYSLAAPVPGLGWSVLLETPAEAVRKNLSAAAWTIYGMGVLGATGLALLCALLWWVAVGREQAAAARRFESLYRVIAQQKRLLDGINMSLEAGLLMADAEGRIQICNPAFARMVEREEADLPGTNLASLFRGTALGRMMDALHSVIRNQESTSFEIAPTDDENDCLLRVTLFPFRDGETDGEREGAVAIFQDITEFRRAGRLRARRQKSGMAALVRAVESVDPYLTGHSHMMEALGGLAARKLGLSERDQATIRSAAELSQVGKLFVPRELLTKTERLTPEEQAQLAKVPEHAYTVLNDIDFDLPVARAVYEIYERMDGSGYPRRLSGEEIGIHARVLAVVNAFAAMVSPRSYRAGMPVAEALERLRASSGSFDPAVVDALDAVLRTPEGAQAVTGTRQEAQAGSAL